MKTALIAILVGIAYTASANQCNLDELKKAMIGSDQVQDRQVACYGNGKDIATAGASFVNLAFYIDYDWWYNRPVLDWRQDEYSTYTSWKYESESPERQMVPQTKLDSNNCDSQNFYYDYDHDAVTRDMQWKKGKNGGKPTITDKDGNTHTLDAAPCDKIAGYPDQNFP